MRLSVHKRRGFTLTEIAIVLGIIGTVLGAIWVAAATVLYNQRVSKTVSDLMLMANNFRALNTVRPFSAPAQNDITCAMVEAGIFPPSMVRFSCSVGNTSTYPVTPWGAPVVFYAPANSPPDASVNQFETWFPNIGAGYANVCDSILIQLLGAAKNAGITYLYDDSGWRSVGSLTPTSFSCSAHNGFSVDWTLQN